MTDLNALPLGYPMGCAPRDGTPILVRFDDAAGLPHVQTAGNRLRYTPYGMWREGGHFKAGKGFCVAVWGGAAAVDESGEGYGPFTRMPDWWFEDDGVYETVVYPIRWWPVPEDWGK